MPNQTSPCEECGAQIPDAEPSEISSHHDESCSLHPSAVFGG